MNIRDKHCALVLLPIVFTVLLIAGCGGTQYTNGAGQETQKIAGSNHSYRLGPHDVLSLSVFGEEALTKDLEVDGQGRINIPLLGKLNIRGNTVEEAEDFITARLKDGYFKDPKVTLAIIKYRNFYVHGEVREPGAYPYQTGLTVLKAITYAGGFTDRAARGSTEVIRVVNGKEVRIDGEMNTLVQPDDVVLIPESFF